MKVDKIVWKAGSKGPIALHVVEETPSFYVFKDDTGYTSRQKKSAHWFFDTWEVAYAQCVENAKEAIEIAQQKLKWEDERLLVLLSLTKPKGGL